MVSKLLLIGIGGFVGAILRYLVGGLAQTWLGRSDFPIATLTVNVLGCFMIGFLASLGELRQVFTPNTRLLILTGLLGAFTTYSTFGYETIILWQGNLSIRAAANVGLHLLLGLGAIIVGQAMAKLIGSG